MNKNAVLSITGHSTDKLIFSGILLNSLISEDYDVQVFLLIGGAYAFRNGNIEKNDDYGEFNSIKTEYTTALKKAKIPGWINLFYDAKRLGNVKISACATAAEIWGAQTVKDFSDAVDQICYTSDYIHALEKADISFQV